jgi:anti-sigma regulatory factor (Ser/Thr protein kinase)
VLVPPAPAPALCCWYPAPPVSPKQQRASKQVRLRPQNPFDLIRLLARSQSDPRKAIGELVQNSLDAGAETIEIEWFNHDGRRALRIWDDGEGVFPELEREQALRKIAGTIGHSHKLGLTPAERREKLVQGQYGIGLIGFWSVGEVLEIKSRVGGGRPLVLRLLEDRATGEMLPPRQRRVGDDDTYTEVTIRRIHEGAINRIRPPRLQAYLANELRGQLLERRAIVRIRDRVARGRARKEFVVEPRPYLGRPLEDWRELTVPGFESARVELYLVAADEERRGVVALACGGTVVLDDLAEIDGADSRREPWATGRLEGMIDFPELHVAPASRRGFTHDEPVAALLDALSGLEAEIGALLEQESARRRRDRQESVARDIRRAFRSVVRSLGDYDFFGVTARGTDGADGGAPGTATGKREDSQGPAPAGEALGSDATAETETEEEENAPQGSTPAESDQLFPPGPLAKLELRPRGLRVPPLATRSIRARALDGDGRPCAGAVEFTWQLSGPGELVGDGRAVRYTAPAPDPSLPDEFKLHLRATQGSTRLEAEARIQLLPPPGGDALVQGIPEPRPVSAPAEPWRSRFHAGSWEYNDAHRDFLAIRDDEPRRLAYLVHLMAKELVLRNFGNPADGEVLERMVEVLTYLDRPRLGRASKGSGTA